MKNIRNISLKAAMCGALLTLFFQSTTGAGDDNIDSLQSALRTAVNDTLKVTVYNRLFYELEFEDTAQALTCLRNALELSHKIDYQRGLVNTYINLGYLKEDAGRLDYALKYHLAALRLANESGFKKAAAGIYNSIGIIYDNQGRYTKALENYERALKIKEELGDRAAVARTMNNIGIIHKKYGNYPKALECYFDVLKTGRELDDKDLLSGCYGNLGIVYHALGDDSSALDYYLKSLKIEQKQKREFAVFRHPDLPFHHVHWRPCHPDDSGGLPEDSSAPVRRGNIPGIPALL